MSHGICVGLTMGLIAFSVDAQIHYRITEMDTPDPFVGSAAYDLNDRGQIVGALEKADGVTAAVRWDRTSPPIILPLPAGFSNSIAVAIDNRGAIAGAASKNGRSVGMTWRLAEDFPHRSFSNAMVPVVFKKFSVVVDLQTQPTRPWFGWFRRDPSTFAGYRPAKGRIDRAAPVVTPKGGNAETLAANHLGVSVGRGFNTNGTYRALRWLFDDSVFDLNSVLPEKTPWVLREARGINREGYIVGVGSKNGINRGFMLQPALDPCVISHVVLRDGQTAVTSGDVLLVDLIISNSCSRTLEDIVIRNHAPSGTSEFQSSSHAASVDPADGDHVVKYGSLRPGGRGVVSYSMRIDAPPGTEIVYHHGAIFGTGIAQAFPGRLVVSVVE